MANAEGRSGCESERARERGDERDGDERLAGAPAQVERLPVAVTERVGGYRGYDEVVTELRALARSHAGVVLDEVGRSRAGEPLLGLTIGAPAAKRVTAVLSGLHPMEWIGVETHLELLRRLAESAPEGVRVVSLPVVNPDGYRGVEQTLREGRRRYLRHNGGRVDLNRNFPAFWGGRGAVARLGARLFARGNQPASEPEVAAVVKRLFREPVERALSLHSFGGAVLYPYGWTTRRSGRFAEHAAWAKEVARAIDPARPYRAVQCARWVPGFTSPGMELDWLHEQGALALLVECSRGGLSARHPGSVLEPFRWFNPPDPAAEASAIASAVEPFVRGLPRLGARG